MYKPIKGGTVETIYGIDCWIPPKPPKEEIANYHLPIADQKWIRTGLPEFSPRDIDIWTGTYYEPEDKLDWDAARREEIARQTGEDVWELDQKGHPKKIENFRADFSYVSVPLANFRDKELDRCDPWTGGYWMYVRGKPVWVTPFHYFYIKWWEINVGYPQYRDMDRKIFYLWQWVFENPYCYGMMEAAKRGGGKTYRALAILYLRTIYGRNILSGIQSKTDDDSRDMFQLKLAECYKNLPDFLIPINDNPTDPKTQLRFFAGSKRGRSSMFHRQMQRKAIRSTINFKNAKPDAYDGQTINGVLVRDEEGKTLPGVCNVPERHRITRDCVFRDGKMFGKIYSTTTLAKLGKGGEQYKVLWDGSDQRKIPVEKDAADTKTGMIRVFFPAYETEFFDEYGYSNTIKARKRQGNEREKLKDNPAALISEKLQYPWYESELFSSAGDTCQYDLNILRGVERIVFDPDYNKARVGDFYWRDGIFGSKALWKDNPDNGKWNVSYLFEEDKLSNKFHVKLTSMDTPLYSPLNEERFTGGFDPTKTSKQVDKRRSAAGGTIFMKADPWRNNICPGWVADFVDYPRDPEAAWMEFLIGLFYYGAPFLPENNLGIPSKITEAGCGAFVMHRPMNTFTGNRGNQDTPGIPSTEPMNDLMIKRKQTHIVKYGHLMTLPRVTRVSIEFDPAERNKYDLEVASQCSLIAAERPMPPPAEELMATELFQMWDNSGTMGKII